MPLKSPKLTKIKGKIDVLGVKVDDISPQKAVSEILKMANDEKRRHIVVTINSEFVMLARRNPNFYKILEKADLAVADGMAVVFSKLLFGGKEHVRVTGVDLVEKLCAESAKRAIRVGFLGGFGGVADTVGKRQKMAHPQLKVVIADPGDPTIGFDLKLKKAVDAVGRIDILFVAFGMGQQEFWIERNKEKLNVGVFIGVGGAFDYLAKVKIRAPKLLQNTGLEWLWRLVLDPVRVWRMRVLPAFLILVLIKFCGLLSRNILRPIEAK